MPENHVPPVFNQPVKAKGYTHSPQIAVPYQMVDSSWIVSRYMSQEDHHVPGWTGFNQVLSNVSPCESTIGYLPIIPAVHPSVHPSTVRVGCVWHSSNSCRSQLLEQSWTVSSTSCFVPLCLALQSWPVLVSLSFVVCVSVMCNCSELATMSKAKRVTQGLRVMYDATLSWLITYSASVDILLTSRLCAPLYLWVPGCPEWPQPFSGIQVLKSTWCVNIYVSLFSFS